MVTDEQVKLLMKHVRAGKTLEVAAAKSGMSERTARKWRRLGLLPSEVRVEHTWRTCEDAFAEVWLEVREMLVVNPGLQAKTLFADLQRRYPGRFADGQLRTLQRRVKVWRATEGPPREVFFPQEHEPGVRCESDFCHLTKLSVTIQGRPFAHLLYHFVLPYSNWEAGRICYSESFESLCDGLEEALFRLGGVPQRHRTDRLSAAVQPPDSPEKFTRQYQALLAHYKLEGERIQVGQPQENGDVEQRHHRLKQALDQTLMLRGSRDFASVEEYAEFLSRLFDQLNSGRKKRLAEELARLRPLPPRRLGAMKRQEMRVGPSSTLRIQHNVYSVHSRLIGEKVEVRIFADRLEVWYAQRKVESMPRLRGEGGRRIDYRHIIDWLVRKPGAFAGYHYREELFPSSHFRMAYDALKAARLERADREYVRVLHLAAHETESGVEDALRILMAQEQLPTAAAVEELVRSGRRLPPPTEVVVEPVDLASYDELFEYRDFECHEVLA
jgi:transposase InsO family protein